MKKCLLIEDDRIAQRLPTIILETEGWSVDIVDTGKDALSKVIDNEYQIIITDIGLPDIDGHELSKLIRVKSNNQNLPIIGLSAHVDPTIGEDSEINIIFCKPFTKEIYSQIIEGYFKNKE